ncbi:hypothetical protein EBB59_02535 [Lysobacter pythonis]|uniref:Uncharacterized protein n=1 Tax=Solilutibacter pythonis TaxID=2483112 RepID=A0A3M2I265_9GAMM|nr:hypothetical protein EBB59_02535 [Lysobacter pythonis]
MSQSITSLEVMSGVAALVFAVPRGYILSPVTRSEARPIDTAGAGCVDKGALLLTTAWPGPFTVTPDE